MRHYKYTNEYGVLTEPLTENEIRSFVDKGEYVEGIVEVALSDIIDYDRESFLDLLSMALTNTEVLMDISYDIVGTRSICSCIHIRVTGDASACL